MATTIKDILLAPYEIDVDSRNFTLVKVGKYTEGEKAGQKKRAVLGYFHSLNACITQILHEIVRNRVATLEDLDDQIVSLDTFIQSQRQEVAIIKKWMQHMSIQFDPINDVPPIVPRDVADITEEVDKITKVKNKNRKVATEEVVEETTEEEEVAVTESPKPKRKKR